MAIVVCGKGSTTKSAAKSDPSLVSLRATVPSFGPEIMPHAEVSQEVGFTKDRDWVPAMMPQGCGGSGHTLPSAISAPNSTPALPYKTLCQEGH